MSLFSLDRVIDVLLVEIRIPVFAVIFYLISKVLSSVGKCVKGIADGAEMCQTNGKVIDVQISHYRASEGEDIESVT